MEIVELAMTKDEFEAAYVMWKCGASHYDLAEAYPESALALGWCFAMRAAGKLEDYTVHFKGGYGDC